MSMCCIMLSSHNEYTIQLTLIISIFIVYNYNIYNHKDNSAILELLFVVKNVLFVHLFLIWTFIKSNFF